MSNNEHQGFSLPIYLTLEKSDANTHTQNDGDEINRKNVTDDCTDGFLIQITLDKVIHSDSLDMLSFIGLEMRFEGIDDRRRFRYVEVNIRFEDTEAPLTSRDPEVVDLWPKGLHVWRETTVQTEVNIGGEVGLQGPTITGGSAKGSWAKKSSSQFTSQATFSGATRLLKKKVGNKNGVFLRLNESRHGKSGVVSMIHTGILLRRREGSSGFRAYFEIQATADMKFTWANGLKKLRGLDHKTDPVIFDVKENYCGQQNMANFSEENPGFEMLRKYGDAVAWIELDPVRTYERKDEQWQEAKLMETGGE